MPRLESVKAKTQDHVISRMTEHDLLEVVEIEEACGLSLWGWDAYHAELMSLNGGLMLVARAISDDVTSSEKKLRGFIAARIVGDELHVNNVAVREAYRRSGIGRRLLKEVLTEGERMGARQAFLEVRESNEAAQALYARLGFRAIGRRRDYYSQPKEDALIMSLLLP